MQTTDGWLLDRRIQYAQPAEGYRTGIEPVLLAASVPARAGQLVLEAGTGAGAGLLCLAARVAGVRGVGLEIDAAMAELARRNIRANGLEGLSVVTTDIGRWDGHTEFDHAFSNPPWHDPAGTPSPSARRRLATHEGPVLLEAWVALMVAWLRPGGSLTLILPAAQTGRAVACLRSAGLGGLTLAPLWPTAGRDAKLLMVQGWRGRGGADRVVVGLVLHEADGRFSDAAEAVLRHGGALAL